MFNIFSSPELKSFNKPLSREELIKRSRILIIDDEEVPIIEDIKHAGFSVDLDTSGNEIEKIERNLYDLIILDYGNVGVKYGKDHGLSLLRHIKRVNPYVFVISYTSKSLNSEQSDFFRLTNATLSKDAGIEETIKKIEECLRETFRIERIFASIKEIEGLKDSSIDYDKIESILVKNLKKRKFDNFMKEVSDEIGSKLSNSLVENLFKLIFTGSV